MGLLQVHGCRFASFTLALSLFFVSSTGCDKGLDANLNDRKDERFAEGADRLQRFAAQRLDTSFALRALLKSSEALKAEGTLVSNPVDNLIASLDAMDSVKGEGDAKNVKASTKFSALGDLRRLAGIERARSEASALAVAVEKMTASDDTEVIKTKREAVKASFSAAYMTSDYRQHWISLVPRLSLEARRECFKSCQMSAALKSMLNQKCLDCLDADSKSAINQAQAARTQRLGVAPADDSKQGTGCFKGTERPEEPKAAKSRQKNEERLRKAGDAAKIKPRVLTYISVPLREVQDCKQRANSAFEGKVQGAYAGSRPSDAAFGDKQLTDPWGEKYTYRYPAKGSKDALAFDVCSSGPDKKAGSDDDVCDEGSAVRTLEDHRTNIVKSNAELAGTVKLESRKFKGGTSALVVAQIAGGNLFLGALEAVDAIRRGDDAMVAWRYFTGSWVNTNAYDALKVEFRGTATATVAKTARSFVRESSEFWKYARDNRMQSMGGTVDRYTQFIGNYLNGAKKDAKRACKKACGQLFKDFDEAQTAVVEACRLKCIPPSGNDAVAACATIRDASLKKCSTTDDDVAAVAESKECDRRAEAKRGRCANKAFDAAMPSAHALESAKTNQFYIERPFLAEAEFDAVFVHYAAMRASANSVPFYALAFDFPGRTKERARDYFGRACQQAPALRATCRAVPDEQREAVATPPYYYRAMQEAISFLSTYGTPASTDLTRKAIDDCRTNNSDANTQEACARTKVQEASYKAIEPCVEAYDVAAKKIDVQAAEAKAKIEGAKQEELKKAAKAGTPEAVELAEANVQRAVVGLEAGVDLNARKAKALAHTVKDTCAREKQRLVYTPKPGFERVEPFLATMQAFRTELGYRLATIPEVKEDPMLPSTLSPAGGGGYGLTLAFRTQAGAAGSNGVYFGSGEPGDFSGWDLISKDVALGTASAKSLAEKMDKSFLRTTQKLKGGSVQLDRIQVKAPGNLKFGALASLLDGLKLEPDDYEPKEGEEARARVRQFTFLGRRRVDDSMKMTKLVFKRPRSASSKTGSSFYQFAGDEKKTQCTYVGRSGRRLGSASSKGHVLIYDGANGNLTTAKVVDCDFGVLATDATKCVAEPVPPVLTGLEPKAAKKAVDAYAKVLEALQENRKRLFLDKKAVGTVDRKWLTGNNNGSWSGRRNAKDVAVKPDRGAQFDALATIVNGLFEKGSVRVFLKGDLSYEEFTTLVSAMRYDCEDHFFETITENKTRVGPKFQKNTYVLACSKGKSRDGEMHISYCADTAAP